VMNVLLAGGAEREQMFALLAPLALSSRILVASAWLARLGAHPYLARRIAPLARRAHGAERVPVVAEHAKARFMLRLPRHRARVAQRGDGAKSKQHHAEIVRQVGGGALGWPVAGCVLSAPSAWQAPEAALHAQVAGSAVQELRSAKVAHLVAGVVQELHSVSSALLAATACSMPLSAVFARQAPSVWAMLVPVSSVMRVPGAARAHPCARNALLARLPTAVPPSVRYVPLAHSATAGPQHVLHALREPAAFREHPRVSRAWPALSQKTPRICARAARRIRGAAQELPLVACFAQAHGTANGCSTTSSMARAAVLLIGTTAGGVDGSQGAFRWGEQPATKRSGGPHIAMTCGTMQHADIARTVSFDALP